MTKVSEVLTTGLLNGYAGDTEVADTSRGGFALKSSHFENPVVGSTYHDEWLPSQTGGGQELASIGEGKITRLYAGGVVDHEVLKKLGITEKEVIEFLTAKVIEHGNNTRLFTDCEPEPEGDWQYSYEITDRIESVGLTRAIEKITFKGILVFVHGFEICSIRE